MLAAQYKAGKTTLTGNLNRCLVDGGRWLGVAEVVPVTGNVAVIDTEMSPTTLDAWLRDQGISNTDRVLPIPLRGNVAAFNIIDERVRREWAERLVQHRVDFLTLDCLRPVLDALGLDEHRDAGRFLVALDALLAKAAIGEALVVHHMGHTGERARGDSRIRDWPDVEWRLVRQDDEPSSPRFISAYGRDVEVSETQLHFDAETRHLTLAEGSRRDVARADALDAVIEVLAASAEPLSQRAIEQALAESPHGREAVRKAISLGRDQQVLDRQPRKARGGGWEYVLTGENHEVRQVRESSPANSGSAPSALIERTLPTRLEEGSSPEKNPPTSIDSERITALAREAGWPELSIGRGVKVLAGVESWSRFITGADEERALAAKLALQAMLND